VTLLRARYKCNHAITDFVVCLHLYYI